MSDDYTLLTPENVELRFDVAGLGSRVAAALIDYVILYVGYLAILIGGAFAVSGLGLGSVDPFGGSFFSRAGGYVILALTILLIFFGWWGYFIMFELLWNGQTIGKRRLGLRVVRDGGQPISATASLVRNLLRAVDLFFFVGVLVMLVDGRSRRLGDFAAGTLVVREPRRPISKTSAKAFATVPLPVVLPRQVEELPNADRLTMARYTVIRDFFVRRPKLPAKRSDALARELASRLALLLGVAPTDVGDPVVFLATAARAFEARQTREY